MSQKEKAEESASFPIFDQPKGLIYHYTNQGGLLGIVEKGNIWASHVRFLNDTQEYFAGRSFIERITAFMKNIGDMDEATEEVVEQALKTLDELEIYVASFSTANDGDSLELWRAYARTIPGYSIGFSAEALNHWIHSVKNAETPASAKITGLYGVQYIHEIDEHFQIRKSLIWLP